MDQNELSLNPFHLEVPLAMRKMISERIAGSAQTVYPSCVKINIVSETNRNELPLDPRHVGVPLGASKKIFQPMLHSAQTMHLSCAEINTVSRQTETSLHLTHIT
jgi:hypothetical protein